MVKYRLVLAILIAIISTSALAEISVEAGYNLPVCEHSYPEVMVTVSGAEVTAPHGKLYCLEADLDALIVAPPLFSKLLMRVPPEAKITRVYVSAHYFEAAAFHTFICKLPNAKFLELEVAGQLGFIGQMHLNRTLLNALPLCVKSLRLNVVGCDPFGMENVTVHARCQAEKWTTIRPPAAHHLKYLILVYETAGRGEGSVAALGSGNISAGSLTINVEDWLIVDARGNSSLWWKCITELTRDLAQVDVDLARTRYDGCRASTDGMFELQSKGSVLTLFVMPFDAERFFAELDRHIRSADHVQIVAQFFESNRIKGMIDRNQQARITIYVDEAYVVAKETGKRTNFITAEMASEFFQFTDGHPNVRVRLLQTNHDFDRYSITNTIHARSIYIKKSDADIAMIGSAHFRDGAIFRNTEQQIFISGEAAQKASEFFNDLERRSIDYADVPVKVR